MSKSRFSDDECPIAQALNEIGDWWTLLVVREAMYGTERFDEFQAALGIARNVLSDRLKRLVEAGILEKTRDPVDGRSSTYSLTAKGRALWPVLVTLMTWSNRWVAPAGEHRIDIVEQGTGRKLRQICALGVDGNPIDLDDAVLAAGPGASDKLAARVDALFPHGKRPSRRAHA